MNGSGRARPARTRASPSGQLRSKPTRGEIWLVDLGTNPNAGGDAVAAAKLGENIGSEQSGQRPVLIVADQSTAGWGLVTVVPSTTQIQGKEQWPYVAYVPENAVGSKRALFLIHQIRTVSTKRLVRLLAPPDDGLIDEVSMKLADMLKLG